MCHCVILNDSLPLLVFSFNSSVGVNFSVNLTPLFYFRHFSRSLPTTPLQKCTSYSKLGSTVNGFYREKWNLKTFMKASITLLRCKVRGKSSQFWILVVWTLHESFRGIFRSQSSTEDGAFCENSWRFSAVNCFRKKLRLGSEYASEYATTSGLKETL